MRVPVYETAQPTDGGTPAYVELRPNCSLTPAGAAVFFGSVAVVSLTVAAVFVLSGYWPVLPFAGLELALLGWALRVSMRRRNQWQEVVIGEAEVTVRSRLNRITEERVFSRHWARVTLRRPSGWHPSRLLVGSHGRTCEIGAFLTEEERRAAWQRLRLLLGR